MHRLRLLSAAVILAACGSNTSTSGATSSASSGTGGEGGAAVTVDGRTANLHVPTGYRSGTPTPLVVTLHGFSANGFLEELYLDLGPLSDKYGFLYASPDGTVDQEGNRFWNATDACCNYDGSTVDDSAYISELIKTIEAQYDVDPKRVFIIGHSNGAFMAYRMACDHADQIAAIASLAGAMWQDPTKCHPSEPVTVLEAHGTADTEVLYAGSPGTTKPGDGAYPSAETTVKDWASLDGCALTPDASAAPLDVDGNIAGAETSVEVYGQGCQSGTSVTLWTIQGGSHLPDIGDTFRDGVIQYLLAHPKL